MAIKSIVMGQEKVCKHSVKYATDVADQPFDNIYINKDFFGKSSDDMEPSDFPKQVTVTVEHKGTGDKKKKPAKESDEE